MLYPLGVFLQKRKTSRQKIEYMKNMYNNQAQHQSANQGHNKLKMQYHIKQNLHSKSCVTVELRAVQMQRKCLSVYKKKSANMKH